MSKNKIERTLFRVEGITRLAGRAYYLPEIYALLGHSLLSGTSQHALDSTLADIKSTGRSYLSDLAEKKCGQPLVLASIVFAKAEDYRVTMSKNKIERTLFTVTVYTRDAASDDLRLDCVYKDLSSISVRNLFVQCLSGSVNVNGGTHTHATLTCAAEFATSEATKLPYKIEGLFKGVNREVLLELWHSAGKPEQPTTDAQVARLQRRIMELEAKIEDYKRALRSAYRCTVAIQDAVQAAETNIFNWQEELRDEYEN